MHSAARSAGAVGRAAGVSARYGSMAMRNLTRDTRQAGISARQVATGYAGYKIADVLRDAAQAGIEFNRTQDRQRVGFKALLGSEAAAARMMAEVQNLALESPLLDPSTAGDAIRSMLAYGVAQKDVLGDTRLLGDMAAASGKNIHEAMTLGSRALGQIASRGSLSREELNQLSDSVGLSQTAIRKELGLTQKEFAKFFRPGHLMSASRALPAIRAAMRRQSQGASEELAKTTEGQFNIARELLAKNMGGLLRPLYDATGAVGGELAKELDRIAQRDDIDFAEKMGLGKDAVRRHFRTFRVLALDPMAADFERFWDEQNMGEKLRDGFEKAAPRVLDAAADLGVKATGAFARAWWDAGPWAKLFTGLYLARKLGVFGMLGGIAADRFAGRFGQKGTAAVGQQLTLFGDTGKGKAGRAGRVLGGAVAAGMGAVLVAEGPNLMADFAEAVFGDNAFSDEARRQGFDLPTTALFTPEDSGDSRPGHGDILRPGDPRNRRTPAQRREVEADAIARGDRRAGGLDRRPRIRDQSESGYRMPAPPDWHVTVPVILNDREIGRANASSYRKDERRR